MPLEVVRSLTLTIILCHKVWTENESLQNSTWRELSVIELTFQSFASLLEGSHIKWYTDSQASAKVVK